MRRKPCCCWYFTCTFLCLCRGFNPSLSLLLPFLLPYVPASRPCCLVKIYPNRASVKSIGEMNGIILRGMHFIAEDSALRFLEMLSHWKKAKCMLKSYDINSKKTLTKKSRIIWNNLPLSTSKRSPLWLAKNNFIIYNTVLQIIWSLGIIDWHFNSTPLTFWHFLITCCLMFDSKTLSMSGTLLLFKHLPSNTQQHHQHQMTVHILKTLNLKLSFQMNQNHKNSWFPLKKRQGSKRVTRFKLSCKNQLIETLWGE